MDIKNNSQKCGYKWEQDDAESSHVHRKEHKKRTKYLFPQPSEKFHQERNCTIDPELVLADSPRWKQREMYERAWAFKHEFGYDFVQWEDKKLQSDPHVQGFLFADDSYRIVGACAFRDRTETRDTQLWSLQCIWSCPGERRKGHLAACWEKLRARFGDFTVEAPVSDAMQGFQKRNGDGYLLESPA